jgi:putative transposase
MPRPLRFLPAGSVHHIVNRGNDKRILFESPRDYEEFLRLVAWAKHRANIRIPAYQIMRNHWHFVLWPSAEGQVEEFQHLLTTTHAVRWRRRTGTIGQGHVYQDRYRAFGIWSERHYLNVVSYTEGNALRARLVKSAAEWRWSSLCERLRGSRGIVDEGPAELPVDWPDVVDSCLSQEVLDEIRSSLKKW